MEEQEPPIDNVNEDMHHRAEHSGERWVMGVALSAALLAALAAVAALLSGHHANEGMIEQIRASDQWSFFQAKSIKSSILRLKEDSLAAMNKELPEKDRKKLEQYEKEQEQISEKAKEKEELSEKHLRKHMVLARGVTLFQISIAIAAISVLTKRKLFWFVGLGFGAFGVFFLIQGLVLH